MKRNIRLLEFFLTFNSLKSINFLKVYIYREVESNSSNTGGKILCRRFEESLGKYYGTIVARTAAVYLTFVSRVFLVRPISANGVHHLACIFARGDIASFLARGRYTLTTTPVWNSLVDTIQWSRQIPIQLYPSLPRVLLTRFSILGSPFDLDKMKGIRRYTCSFEIS